jgi:hypothetical protein
MEATFSEEAGQLHYSNHQCDACKMKQRQLFNDKHYNTATFHICLCTPIMNH